MDPGRAKRWRRGLGLGLLALALGFAWTAWTLRSLPDTKPLRDPAWLMQRFGLSEWTPLAQCSPAAVRAILVSEDDVFFQHHGLRLDEIGSAAWEDLLDLRYSRGASSLTQQVVKNAFLEKDKTLSRKVREMALARRADARVGKKALLEDYLNLAEWGPHGERGIAWAARTCLGKPPALLDAFDGALLSWLLPDPRTRTRMLLKGRLPKRAKRHVRMILRRLAQEGSLSDGELKALLQRPYPFERLSAPVEQKQPPQKEIHP